MSRSFKDVWWIAFICVFCIFATYGLGFIGWDLLVSKYQQYFLVLIPMILTLINFHSVRGYNGVWKSIIPYMIIMPFISCISKLLILGEDAFSIMYPIYISLTFFMFYAYSAYKVSESTIINGFLIIGLVTLVIQIYQQITGVVYFDLFMRFFTQESTRNDLSRYQIGCPYLQLFCFLYVWDKAKEKMTPIYLVLTALFGVSVYLYLTRQLLAIAIAAIFISFFINGKKQSKKIWVVSLILLIYGMYKYWDALFSNFVTETKTDDGFFIRFVSIEFFFKQTFSNIFGTIFGFGQSSYEERWYSKGIFASDAGISGDMYHYGITWAIAYLVQVYKIFKVHKGIPVYIKLFVIATFINCIFSLPYHAYDQAFIWVSMLYIESLYVNKLPKNSRRYEK